MSEVVTSSTGRVQDVVFYRLVKNAEIEAELQDATRAQLESKKKKLVREMARH